jgi:acetylornithine/succinyldiaminopimelate/putrescine aminotransferase
MLSECFRRRGVTLVKGRNAHVWDEDGKRYIDFLSARSAANLGHNHPDIVAAVTRQMEKLIHYTNDFHIDVQTEYAAALENFMPPGLSRYYFCNSGAETVEAAIKLARARTSKSGILSLKRAFHGRTLGALSATYNEAYKTPFLPLIEGIRSVEADLEAIAREMETTPVGAVIFEPVQGESGVRPLGETFIRSLRDLCDRHSVLLIADEVQSGFGRCGGRFYCERIGVVPDVLLASKSICGGFQMGVVATTPALDFHPGEHGSTFSGHPIACAAGLAALKLFETEKLGQKSIAMESRLAALLSPLSNVDGVEELRIVGAMVGIEIDTDVIDGGGIVDECLRNGLLVNFTGDTVIRLMPPLTIEPDVLEEGVRVLLDVFRSAKIGVL